MLKPLVGVAVLALGFGAAKALPSNSDDTDGSRIASGALPEGYRDWKLISVAHEEGALNDIRAILGNDLAVKTFRQGAGAFPDGAVIARLAWRHTPSAENNAAFGRDQSFTAGPPTNVQFMVKDARRYAATGGWNFVQFNDGQQARTPAKDCFACHVPIKTRDYVFTKYAP
jgi:hypothetical protein